MTNEEKLEIINKNERCVISPPIKKWSNKVYKIK